MTKTFLDDYALTPDAMMIAPYYFEAKMYSKVYTIRKEIYVKRSPLEIIKKACELSGSSYEGRVKGTKRIIGTSIKAPIMINPHLPMYAFPTSSPTGNEWDCYWIIAENLYSFEQGASKREVILSFYNNKRVTIPIPIRTIRRGTGLTRKLKEEYGKYVTKLKQISVINNYNMLPELLERIQYEKLPEDDKELNKEVMER